MGLAALLIAVTLSGCHDDDEPQPSPAGPWTVSVVTDGESATGEPVLSCQASYESLTVSIAGRTADTRSIVITVVDATDNWLQLRSDTLADDGIVPLVTTTNDTGVRRTATLVFTDADNPALSGALTVSQRSASDADDNSDRAREQLYVGYGYNIYVALESPMAVRTLEPIIDLDALRRFTTDNDYETVHDSHLARTDIRYVTTNNIHAYGRDLTTQQTHDTENLVEGCTEDSKMMSTILQEDKGTLDQQNFGHGSLEKAVYARVIDKGALLDLRRRGFSCFTGSFSERLAFVRRATGNRRQQLIEQLLVDYGTHVVMQVDLGGRIDYSFMMQKTSSFNSEEEMRQEIDYTLGRMADDDRTTDVRSISSSKSASGAIIIHGGSQATRSRLQSDVGKLSPTGQIDPNHLTDWLASINYSPNSANDPNLDVIHFELMPVWDLVADDLRQDFLEVTLQLTSRSDCQLPASMLGTDIYEIAPQSASYRSLFDFSRKLTPGVGSLCRLLYFETEPVLEVCSEYVPKIRTDERVTIAYPIYKQQIHLNQGLFLGDGIHQPAYVGFSGADSYVNPIDSLAPGRIIDKFWYVNGNLQLQNPTRTSGLKGKKPVMQEDYLPLFTDDETGAVNHRHPLVKVGSKFWTRRDIDHRMLFAEHYNDNSGVDQMQDNVCYTWFQWEPNWEFDSYNGWIFGYAPNTWFAGKPNQKWYMPTPNDVRELYQFLGFNPKALFMGQQSGWDAQFNGYYGQRDILNQNKYFSGSQRAMRYKGDLNVISSKSSSDYDDACIMVLHPDYSLQLIDNSTFRNAYRANWRLNFYPVRPVRGYMFLYPTTTDITSHRRMGSNQ